MDEIKEKCAAHGSFQWEAAELVARVSDDNSPDNIADLVEFCIRVGMEHGIKHQRTEDARGCVSIDKRGDRVKSMGKVVASRKYPVDGWQSFEEGSYAER